MEAALMLCGFNAATAQYLIDQGFITPEALLLATEADLDTIARNVTRTPPRVEGGGTVTMPFIALKHLKGFRFWADECKRTGFEPDSDTFAEEDVTSYTEKYLEYTAQKDAAKDEDPTKPEALKKLGLAIPASKTTATSAINTGSSRAVTSLLKVFIPTPPHPWPT
jgi:hypothetical protein